MRLLLCTLFYELNKNNTVKPQAAGNYFIHVMKFFLFYIT